jgi:hypothetical protein
VTVTGTTVTVSLAARLALLAAGHRTRTTEPNGYRHPADLGLAGLSAGLNKPGGRSGRLHDRTSAASCSCRRWSTWAEDRARARALAAQHRQQATAAMLRQLQNGA